MAAQKSGDKPLCVVTDVDDTLILHPDYWGSMIATKHDAFDDPLWDEHIKHDKLMTVLVDTSNKEKVQKQIARDRTIAVYLGDSLNDFQRVYYVKDVDQRNALMEKDKELFGRKFVILPNPTDGHWVRAIFGESEPAPTKQNRQTWKKAAEKQQSRGIREHMGK